MMVAGSSIRVRGHGRRKRRTQETDWQTIAGLLITADMSEEEFNRFLWAHPELEEQSLRPARTRSERRWLPRVYERQAKKGR